jgi:hypothetical protein
MSNSSGALRVFGTSRVHSPYNQRFLIPIRSYEMLVLACFNL